MRRPLNSAEAILLRTHPQSTRLYLHVDQPPTVFAAQVNAAVPGYGLLVIPYTLTGGAYAAVVAGDTVLVGTSNGDYSYGTAIVVSVTATVLTVQANTAHWIQGAYLLVRHSGNGVWSGLTNFTASATSIVYDGVTTGAYTAIVAGQTLYLGSALGGSDLGKVRVKSATATTLTVAANSDVVWADNAYITIKDTHDLWSIYSYIDLVSGIWYRDSDAYDTNVYRKPTVWLPPIPIMGPPGVAFLDSGAATLLFSGEDSYTMCSNGIKIAGVSQGDVGIAAACAWAFPAGTPATATTLGTEIAPHSVAWSTAGRYMAALTVSNDHPANSAEKNSGTLTVGLRYKITVTQSNYFYAGCAVNDVFVAAAATTLTTNNRVVEVYAKQTTGYRPVFILNRPGTALGINEPYVNFSVDRLRGDFQSGGWTATIRVFGDADESQFPTNAMLVLFAEEFWGAPGQVINLATSTTSNAIGTGAKTFTTQTGLGNVLVAGAAIKLSADTTHTMTGTITSYNATTGSLVVSIASKIGATDTFTSWTIALIGPVRASIGGYPGRENVKLVAWIMSEDVTVGFAPDGERYVEFEVATIDGLLGAKQGNSIAVEDRSSMATGNTEPTEWYQVFKLQINRMALYALAFGTTLLAMADCQILADNSRMIAGGVPSGSLYRQIDDYAASSTLSRLLSSRQSTLHLERDVQTATAQVRAAVPTVLALNKNTDLREKFSLPRPHTGKVRKVDLEGISYVDGGAPVARIAYAPGPDVLSPPRQDGIDDYVKGYIVDDQPEANELAGAVLAAKNNPWTGLSFELQGNWSYLDIAPQGYLTLSLAAADTKRGIIWTDQKLLPRGLTLTYDAAGGTLLTDMSADALATGTPGLAGDYVVNLPVVYNPPHVPISVPGWNNTAYAGQDAGEYSLLAGVCNWQRNTTAASPFDATLPLVVRQILIDPGVVTAGVNTDVLLVTSQGLFRSHRDLTTHALTWTKWAWTAPVAPGAWTTLTEAEGPFWRIAADWIHPGTFYVVAVSATLNEAYLGKTSDDGATWAWLPLIIDTTHSIYSPTHGDQINTCGLDVDKEDATRIYVWGLSDAGGGAYATLWCAKSDLSAFWHSRYDTSANASYPLETFGVFCPFIKAGSTLDGSDIIMWGIGDTGIGVQTWPLFYHSNDQGKAGSMTAIATSGVDNIRTAQVSAVDEADLVIYANQAVTRATYATGGDTWENNHAKVLGQGFKVTVNSLVSAVTLRLKRAAGTTGEFFVYIFDDDGSNLPRNILCAAGLLNIASLSETGADFTIHFGINSVFLAAGIQYHIAILSTPTGGGDIYWYRDAAGASYADGQASQQSLWPLPGGAWSALTGSDFYFSVIAGGLNISQSSGAWGSAWTRRDLPVLSLEPIYSTIVFDRHKRKSNIIMVGANQVDSTYPPQNTILLSVDAGLTWKPYNSGLALGLVNCVAIDWGK